MRKVGCEDEMDNFGGRKIVIGGKWNF